MPTISELAADMIPNISLIVIFHIIYALTWGLNRDFIRRYLGRYTHIIGGTFFGLVTGLLIARLGDGMNYQTFLFCLTALTIIGIFSERVAYAAMITTLAIFSIFNPQISFTLSQMLTMIIASAIIVVMSFVEEQKKAAYLFSALSIFGVSFVIQLFSNGIAWLIVLFFIYLFVIVSTLLSYAMLSLIESIYSHAKQLQVITEYERGSIVRSALRADALKNFIAENRIRYGFVSILGFEGIEEVRKSLDDDAVDELMEKVTKSLEEILHNENVIFFRSHDEKYGILLNHKGNIESVRKEQAGNFKKKRDENDFLHIMESALEKLAVHYVVKNEWVKIVPHCGTAIIGLHTNDVDEVITYADFALRTRNDLTAPNIVQLFNIEKYLTHWKDSLDSEKLKKVVNINSLYSGFSPVYDLKKKEIFGYKANLKTDGTNHLNEREVHVKADKHNLGTVLYRLVAQISLRSFKGYKDYPLFIKYDHKILNEKFNPSEFMNKIHRFGGSADTLILRIMIKKDFEVTPHFVTNVLHLKSLGVRFVFDSIDKLGDNFELLFNEVIPNYVSVSTRLLMKTVKNDEAKEMVESYIEFARSRKIKFIANDVDTKLSIEIANDLGIRFVSGPIIGEKTQAPKNINETIGGYLQNITK